MRNLSVMEQKQVVGGAYDYYFCKGYYYSNNQIAWSYSNPDKKKVQDELDAAKLEYGNTVHFLPIEGRYY